MKRGIETFTNKVVAITGAGSGIGRAAVILLSQLGAKLAISDINPDGLEETKRLASLTEDRVLSFVMDVSMASENDRFAQAVLEKFGCVDMFWCNAGIAHDAISAWKMPLADLERMMNVNFWGMVHGTRAFVPLLLQNPNPSSVVTTISSNGIIANGFMSGYTASKFGIRGWFESLAFELETTSVKAHLIFPGGVKTNIAINAIGGQDKQAALMFSQKMLTGDVMKVTEGFLNQVLEGRVRIFGGARSRIYDIVSRIYPYHLYAKLQVLFAKNMIELGRKNSGL